MRAFPVRPVLITGLVVGLALGGVGCSSNPPPGSQAPVLESDKESMQKSAEARTRRMQELKKQPRSKQRPAD